MGYSQGGQSTDLKTPRLLDYFAPNFEKLSPAVKGPLLSPWGPLILAPEYVKKKIC
jgi:hypothetical protein